MFDRLNQGLWWDRALTLVEGCTRVSPACDNCWAMAMEHRFGKGATVRFCEERLWLPKKVKKPTAWAVWNDLFHETVDVELVKLALTALSFQQQHIFLVLTKRPENIATAWALFSKPPENIWLGVTAENQEQADKRIPILLQIPAAVRFMSCEPLLSNINLTPWLYSEELDSSERLNWVICGGESGPHARPAHPDWFRAVRDQCVAAGVPFFFKQIGKKKAGRLLDGQEWNQIPEAKR